MKRSVQKLTCLLALCLAGGILVSVNADPITLTVTNWNLQGYYDEGVPSVKIFSFQVINAGGKVTQLDLGSLLNGYGSSASLGVDIGPLTFLEALIPGSTTNLSVQQLSYNSVGSFVLGQMGLFNYSNSSTSLGQVGEARITGSLSFFYAGQKIYDVSLVLTGTGSTVRRTGGEFVTTTSGTTGTITVTPVMAAVPEPATLLLLGSGLAAIGVSARRRKRK